MQDFALGIAHVVLKLGEQGDGGCHRGVLKHILLPVLAQRLALEGHGGREVVLNNLLLGRVVDHLHHVGTVGVDGVEEGFTLSDARRQHDVGGSLQVFLATDIVEVCILAICFAHDAQLELLRKVED